MESKVALITGVSSGIGRAMARCFKKHGCKVIGVSRSQPDIDIDLWIAADITRPEERERIRREAEQAFGRVDILINNAGMGLYNTWEECRIEEVRALFELNFFAMLGLTKELLPLLKESRGTVINISSAAGKIWVYCMGAYCASKAAVTVFSQTLRGEVAKYGVKVMDVCPGQINTGFSSRSFGSRKPPDSPGASSGPEEFAETVYKAWRKGKKSLTYPSWLGSAIFVVKYLLPGLYNRLSRKKWGL